VRERFSHRNEQGGLAQDEPDTLLDLRALTIAKSQPESCAQAGKLMTESALRMAAIRASSAKRMPADEAVQLQLKVGGVPPESIIQPRAGGRFDVTEEELEW
jgi:hypothetical protein